MRPYAPDVNHMENTEPGVSYEETNKLSDHLQTESIFYASVVFTMPWIQRLKKRGWETHSLN